MKVSLFKKTNFNILYKYSILNLKKKSLDIKTFNLSRKIKNNLINFDFFIVKKRPSHDLLKKEENEVYNNFNFKYLFGFFSGCTHFSFRITFKEYKVGLKPAKFSLLLNQFCLNLDLFINLVQEVLVNNFPLNFYENFFQNYLNDVDFKLHFLVILRTQDKKNTTTKFFLVPKGCFIGHLRDQLWLTLFSDPLFLYSLSLYYKGFKFNLSLIFLLLIYYIYRLINLKIVKLINKHKVYDYEQRTFESLGNILNLKFNSYKLYCKSNLRLPRYSYFFSYKCLDFFIDDLFEEKLDLNYILNENLKLDIYFDSLVLNEDLNK